MSQIQPPMIGTWDVQVLASRPFTIHGDLYYELQARRIEEQSNNAYVLRVPQHAVQSPPQMGEKLRLTFLMGQITAAQRITS